MVDGGVAWPVYIDGTAVPGGSGGGPSYVNAVIDGGFLTADTELPAAAALGDAVSNPTAPAVGGFLMGWEPGASTWNRVRTSPVSSDDEAGHAQGALDTMSHSYFFDGTNWDRMRGTIADGLLVNLGTNNDVTQGGTWTVQPGNTPNTAPWLVTPRKVAATALASAFSCTTSAAPAPTTALTNRTSLCITNLSPHTTIYVGHGAVTASTGTALAPAPTQTDGGIGVGGTYCDDVGAQPISCITPAGTADVRLLEQ
jgi:hypothetical protein